MHQPLFNKIICFKLLAQPLNIKSSQKLLMSSMDISSVEIAHSEFRSVGTFDYDLNLKCHAEYLHPIAYSICFCR